MTIHLITPAAILQTIVADIKLDQLTNRSGDLRSLSVKAAIVYRVVEAYFQRGPNGWAEFCEDVSSLASAMSGQDVTVAPTLEAVAEVFGGEVDDALEAAEALAAEFGEDYLESKGVVTETQPLIG